MHNADPRAGAAFNNVVKVAVLKEPSPGAKKTGHISRH
jgi:hypothetical protein